jgi:hypothetical protein
MVKPVKTKYDPIGIKEIVMIPKGGYVAYNKVFILIELKSIVIPMAEINRYLRISWFVTKVEAVKNATLKNKAAICFVALNNRMFTSPDTTGDDMTNELNISTKFFSNGNKK